MKIVQKRSFQVMRDTFCPNRICERHSSQNRHTGLKFSSKRENNALSMKIVQNALFRSCAAFFSPNRNLERQSSQNRHTGFKFSSKRENSALSIKSVQNTHFRSCAARFGQIAFWIVKVFKIVMASNSLQHRKTVRFPWKLYKTLFSGVAEHVSAKSHLRASKFSKSSHWHKILFKTGKTMRSPWKLYKTLFSGHAQLFFRQIAIWSVKVLKIVTLASNSLQNGKQCAFDKKCTKHTFQVMRSTFRPNRILDRQSFQNRHGL